MVEWLIFGRYRLHNKFLISDQMDMVVNLQNFNIIIFHYQMFTHLLNLLDLGQNIYQKLLMSWWMSLRNATKNTYKIHMNEGQRKDF
jgi:hypothetical protein